LALRADTPAEKKRIFESLRASMREISIVGNPTVFREMIGPISPSVRGLMSPFPRAWPSIVVDRAIGVTDNAELLIGLLQENFLFWFVHLSKIYRLL
jgi:hypothetical protein